MSALLTCQGLTCRFGGLVALDAVDFHVEEGEIVGLIGPNGSGKTTLFNVVTGIYGADAGNVIVAGTDMTGAAPQAVYRAGVTRTFQRSRMCLPLSVFDNIMVGNHKRLNHGLVFNLLRRRASAVEFVRSRIPGLTIVIIEHEMGVIERITDRCVVLNYGRKIKEGTFAEVAADRQVQEAYLGVA